MWEIFKPENNIWYCWRLNGAQAYLKKDGDVWQFAFKTLPFHERTDDFGGPETENPPEDLSITCAYGNGEGIFLHPYLSNQPYVLKINDKIRVVPGQKVYFTAILPPVFKFEQAQEVALAENMPLTTKRTLFGPDFMDGKLGHHLNNSFLSTNECESMPISTLIYCDIVIKNSAKTVFDLDQYFVVCPEPLNLKVYEQEKFEKYIVNYNKPLNIYLHDDRLITDTLELEISGDILGTGIEQKINIQNKNLKDKLITMGTKTNLGDQIVRRSVGMIRDFTKDIL